MLSEKTGFLIVLSAPSGCGKTTLLSRLLKRHPDWVRSISVTTRAPRLGEKTGKDYEFVSLREFQSLKAKKQFLESAHVFGQYYGTRKAAVEDSMEKGRTVVLTLDVQGARSVRRLWKRKVPLLSIFVLPPSVSILRDRLQKRSTDSLEEIEKRIQRAEEEIKAAREYEGTVINHDLDQTVHEIEALVEKFKKKLDEKKSERRK
jgi:guanylate kinase